MVSALAFGYGVGMAAPDATISSMHTAVAGYPAPTMTASLVVPPPPVIAPVVGGLESRELGRLRVAEEQALRGGASCDLDRPVSSRAPRYESRRDRLEADDADDLDGAGAEALSRLQLPDLKIAITRRTLKYVKFFARTDRGRGMFETWLRRSGRYQELIQTELRERRLPEDLIWVAMIESGFDPRAKSPAGAVGLWQFMPSTGAVYGLQRSQLLDQRRNPRLATQAAAHHLRDLYMRFGEWDLALAAYNMGYEQLLDAIDRYGTTDFNELARQEAIPSETAAYVPKIAAAAIVANNLEHFGFERVELSRPVDAAEIAIPPGTPLRTVAKAAGVSTAAIRTLNPDYLGERVPPGRGDFMMLVPADTLARAQTALPAMLETEPLQTGDASVLDPVDLLAGRAFKARRIHDEDESLLAMLPHPKRRSMRNPVDDGDDGDDHRARADRRGDELEPEDPFRRKPKQRLVLYKIGAGDTLGTIAKQLSVDVDELARDNHLERDAHLREGALLRVRAAADVIARETASAAAPEPRPKTTPDAPASAKRPSRDPSPVERAARQKRERGAEHVVRRGKKDA
jgi:membrane-bound lytic murein transglycosylase D